MGCMSASDAAPLPRLGEVFFDVRGESRSMRLSWYADTGVAVFSIWQGGTCTGTFRLPIADLPRMVDSLQRGPHARDDLITGEQPASREPRLPGPPGLPDGDIRTDMSPVSLTESLVGLVMGILRSTPTLGVEGTTAVVTSLFLDGARTRGAAAHPG